MLFSTIINSGLIALSSGFSFDHNSQIEKALQMATMNAAFLAERDFKNHQNLNTGELI